MNPNNPTNSITTKVFIEDLPVGGDDRLERRVFSVKGEMAQILNRADQAFKQLVYWELDSAKSGQERGHHYHEKKIEHFYVLTGELELSIKELESSVSKKIIVKAGNRLDISPRVAHAFRSLTYAQVLEYSSEPYDPSDTHSYKVIVKP
ncbi:MAG: WxcM-like domain-containing protein [Proteobacteria bacterium]|nr:WxcM-like domain-containing protein [Pseudomonadota bacterium]